MKTDIDPLFEQKDNREFGKQFAIDITVILTTAFVMALLVVILYFRNVIDDIDPIYQVVLICVPGIAFWIYKGSKAISEYLQQKEYDYKHNDQR